MSVDTIVRFSKETLAVPGQSTDPNRMTFLERARTVMKLQSEIRNHQEISGTLSLASFMDLRDSSELKFGQRRARQRVEKTIKDRLHEELAEDSTTPRSIASLLALPKVATPGEAPNKPQLNAAGDELWRISAQAAILSDIDLQVLTTQLDEIAERHLANVKVRRKGGQEARIEGVGHVVTGLIPVFLRTQQAVLESLIKSFGLAFGLIAIVMMILLRSIRAGLITMLPNLMPVIMVFGLLSWARLRVDIGTMITASVALGIAVDGTLHLITWFQKLLKRGRTIPEAVSGALEHCGPAMWQTSAVVGLGMLALLPAELLLISRFGWMLAALIFAALVADIVFLPALLAGPLGTLIQRSVQKQQAQDETRSVSSVGTLDSQQAATISFPMEGSRRGLN
ncbi:MAG: MMPL family transporter [Fuerstiella sp.]|nr:MMPL family transporter [Fuerstiella sp.]